MSSIAIPATPPPANASLEAGAAPTAADDRFGDTLRQTQSAPKPKGDAESTGDPADAPPATNAKAPAETKGDDDAHNDPNAAAGLVPPAAVIPLPVRQAAAGSGKTVPAATTAGTKRSTPDLPAPAVTAMAPIPIAAAAAAVVATTATSVKPASGPAVPAATAPLATLATLGTPGNAAASQAPDNQAADGQGFDSQSADSQIGGSQPGDNQSADVQAAVSQLADNQATSKDGSLAGPSVPAPGPFAAQLAQLAAGHAGAAPAPPPPPAVQLAMQASPGQPQFAQETAQHVSWLVGQNIQQARIQLNPPELGPIDVQITTNHDRVDVSFAVQHPQTVNALQQTLPQLQNMLGQHGLNLGQASVGQQAPRQQQAAPMPFAGSGRGASSDAEPPSNWRTLRVATPGRVDDFA